MPVHKSGGDIFSDMTRIAEVSANAFAQLEPYFLEREPFIVRGLVAKWPLVLEGLKSGDAAREYLLEKHKENSPFIVSKAPASEKGRIFYNENMAVNIQSERRKFPEILAHMAKIEANGSQELAYLGSVSMPTFFDGLHTENTLDFGTRKPIESIWIGTQSRIAAHNDFPQNLACVAAGRRRFTLFPPDQIDNLYIGPIDNTPAGRPMSMVDFHEPDHAKHPKFTQALKTAQLAELGPGDAIYIPSMWWHHVESLAGFNVLVNYWWRDTPRYLGQPQNALNHAMMAIRDLPDDEKAQWRKLFNHYVFDNDERLTMHIPEKSRGVLGAMNAENASKMRSFLIRMLSDE